MVPPTGKPFSAVRSRQVGVDLEQVPAPVRRLQLAPAAAVSVTTFEPLTRVPVRAAPAVAWHSVVLAGLPSKPGVEPPSLLVGLAEVRFVPT